VIEHQDSNVTRHICSLHFYDVCNTLPCALKAGLTKGISFSHEYSMWLGSSHRVLADSETDFRRPSMSIAQT